MRFPRIASALLASVMVAEGSYAATLPAAPVVPAPMVTPSPVIAPAIPAAPVVENPGVVVEDSSIVIPDPATFANETDPVFKAGFGANTIDVMFNTGSMWENDYYGLSGSLNVWANDGYGNIILRNPVYADYEIKWDLSPTDPALNYRIYDGEGAPTNVSSPWASWKLLSEKIDTSQENVGPTFGVHPAPGRHPVTSNGEKLAGFIDGQEVKVKVSLRNIQTNAVASWLVTFTYIAPEGIEPYWGTNPTLYPSLNIIAPNISRIE